MLVIRTQKWCKLTRIISTDYYNLSTICLLWNASVCGRRDRGIDSGVFRDGFCLSLWPIGHTHLFNETAWALSVAWISISSASNFRCWPPSQRYCFRNTGKCNSTVKRHLSGDLKQVLSLSLVCLSYIHKGTEEKRNKISITLNEILEEAFYK